VQWLLLHPGKTVDARTAMPRGQDTQERLHKNTTMELIERLLGQKMECGYEHGNPQAVIYYMNMGGIVQKQYAMRCTALQCNVLAFDH
jgi:hypothetical protein